MRVLSILCLLLVPFSASANIYFSEIMWMGTDLSVADEWIEFQCRDTDTDLTGYRLVSVAASGTGSIETDLFSFDEDILAESGSVFLLSNFDADHSRLQSEPAFVASSVALSNERLHLRLYDGSGALVDEVFAGPAKPFAGMNTTGMPRASMERMRFDLSGSDPLAWRTSQAFFGFDTGSVVFGTPGLVMSQQPEVIPESSSGTVSSPSIPLLEISEVLADPVGSDDAEWIELRNLGDTALTLSGFVLQVGSKTQVLSGSGLLIQPDATLVLHKPLVPALPNAGGSITLRDPLDRVIDSLNYTQSKEGISTGRLDGEILPFCLPSPGLKNDAQTQELLMTVQSGNFSGSAPLSLNLETVLSPAKPAPFSCRIDFGDGTVSETCNPPNHTYDDAGTYSILIEATTQCGNTLTRSETVIVRPSSSTATTQSSSVASTQNTEEEICPETASNSITISELYPHPKKGEKSEWIELKNSSRKNAPLCGWTIADEKSRKKLDAKVVPAAGYLVLTGSISLNDGGDSIHLTAPDGSVQSVTYGSSKEGLSLVADKTDAWVWSARPTPGTQNIVPTDAPRLPVHVSRVIDGDTFVAELQSSSELFPGRHTIRVRLLGIEAPESVHPTKGLEAGGKEASEFLRALIQGKNIELQFDTNLEDIYDRELAYAYLSDGTLVQKRLIQAGVAKAYFRFPFSQEELFRTFHVEPRSSSLEDDAQEDDAALQSEENSEHILYSIDLSAPSFPGFLSEIYGHPSKGQEEWIELHNPLEEVLSLSGWTLQDTAASKKPFRFSSRDFLEPQGYITVFKSRSKLSINDTGDELMLRSPQGHEEKITIPKLSEAESYLKIDAAWCISTASSQNEVNVCVQPISKTKIKNTKIAQKTIKASTNSFKTSIPGVKLAFLPKSSSSMAAESGTSALFEGLAEPQAIGSMEPKGDFFRRIPWTELSVLTNVALVAGIALQRRPRKKGEKLL